MAMVGHEHFDCAIDEVFPMRPLRLGWLVLLLLPARLLAAADGNRLAYLDAFCDPYYVGLNTPKLTTPQWVGEPGVEAVAVLSIDDMSDPKRYESFLRPILERLKKIDDRGPVSVMTTRVDPKHPQLRKWFEEGVSVEAHTHDHPCPCLRGDDFAKAKGTYDRCVDLLAAIPGGPPVAFRMPCCDSMNSMSPRFYTEIFNKTTPRGKFLQMNSSVFMLFTPNDPALARELVFEEDGRQRFAKYVPRDRRFVNYVEDYPYPYVIGRLCWEMPTAVPDDWQGHNLQGPHNPITLRDMKAALDAAVIKQGVYTLTFHPGGWIRNDQVIELVDHAAAGRPGKVKFLSFRDVHDRLTKNLLAGHPLRASNGQDNGVRLLDVDHDGAMDVVVGNEKAQTTRVWSAETGRWTTTDFPVDIVTLDRKGNRSDAGVRFGVLDHTGRAGILVRNERVAGLWHFDGRSWVSDPRGLDGLELDGPVHTARSGRDRGVRLRDLDGDGLSELIVGNPQQQGVFHRRPDGGWAKLPFTLPPNTSIVDAAGRDAGLRMVDVDRDNHLDVVFSNAERYSVHCFTSMTDGWSQALLAGSRKDEGKVPMIVRADGTNNGAWFSFNHMWVQNEQTGGKLPHQIESRHYTDLLGTGREPPDRSPEDSLRSFEILEGFAIELVAAEPMVMDPADLGWGPDGKLWIVEYADYPLGLDDRGKPGGRIRFLEDTDGDGRYDASTVFLEPVAYPMGILPWRKGVLVTAAPEIFYAEDTDGDGRADLRKPLFVGFGEGNQQHRVNHPRWGLDNWVHAANGDSGGTIRSVTTGQTVNISGRDLRFKPDEGLIDPQTGQTQFGTNRDDWGNWFGCNNSNPGWHAVLADHYVRRNPHVVPPSGRVDVAADRTAYPAGRVISHCDLKLRAYAAWGKPGAWTSVAGVTIYRDDLFGPHFTGNLFVNDSVYCVVHRRILEPSGVTFRSERGPDEPTREFLASHDVWFRPSTQETGPDGALWVLDMHRFVIEHPEWIADDLEKILDLRAGHEKGRIYRIYPVDKRPRPIPRLDQLDTAGLVAALDSPNGWQRDTAHQMLLWRNDRSAIGPLEGTVQHGRRPLARLHALCALDGLGTLRPEIVMGALADEHPGVRRHAIRVSEPLLSADPSVGPALLKLEEDPDPMVQMQLAYSLGEWHDPEAGRLLGRMAADSADDRYLAAAVMSSATGHLEAMIAEVMPAGAEQAAPRRLVGDLLSLAVALRNQKAVAQVLGAVTVRPPSGFAQWQFEAMTGLLDTLDRRKTTLTKLTSGPGDELERSRLQIRALFDAARSAAVDGDASPALRAAAFRMLGRGLDGRDEDLALLVGLLAPQSPIEVQLAVVESIRHLDDDRVPELLLKNWLEQGPKVNTAIVDALLSRPAWSGVLVDAIERQPQLASILGTTRRDMLLRHPVEAIRNRAQKLLGAVTTSEEIQKAFEKYRPVLELTGDAARGKKAFVNATCADCHKLDDVGTDITTDLRTLVDKSPDALLTAVIDPNRAVEDKYVEYTAVTTDGLMLTGMLLEETSSSVTLADTAGKLHPILRKDLEELVSTGRSHMPEKLEAKMTFQEMADVFAFIAQSGPPRREVAGNTPRLIAADPDGSLKLLAAHCEIYGPRINVGGSNPAHLVWFYDGPNDHVVWQADVPAAGTYEVWIQWAQIDEYADNPIAIEVEGTKSRLTTELPSTGGWGRFQDKKFGELALEAGRQRIRLRPNGPTATEVSDLRGLRLAPVAASR
jgi:putative membrane-bound dehydrogenase-like protein